MRFIIKLDLIMLKVLTILTIGQNKVKGTKKRNNNEINKNIIKVIKTKILHKTIKHRTSISAIILNIMIL